MALLLLLAIAHVAHKLLQRILGTQRVPVRLLGLPNAPKPPHLLHVGFGGPMRLEEDADRGRRNVPALAARLARHEQDGRSLRVLELQPELPTELALAVLDIAREEKGGR